MTREELIEFVTWLDEGTDYFGKSYIEVKTDEWLKMKAKNIVAKPVLADSFHGRDKEDAANIEEAKKDKLSCLAAVSGTISICRYGRLTQRAIKSKTKWFDECEYYTIKSLEDSLIITKHRFHIPKNAHKYTKGTGLKVEMDLPYGDFVFDDDESTEDELVIYYR